MYTSNGCFRDVQTQIVNYSICSQTWNILELPRERKITLTENTDHVLR